MSLQNEPQAQSNASPLPPLPNPAVTLAPPGTPQVKQEVQDDSPGLSQSLSPLEPLGLDPYMIATPLAGRQSDGGILADTYDLPEVRSIVQDDSYMAATPIQPDGIQALRELLDSVDVSPETPYSAEGYGRAQPAPEPPYGSSTAVVEHHSHPYEPTATELPSESSGGAAQVTERPNVSSGNGVPTMPPPQREPITEQEMNYLEEGPHRQANMYPVWRPSGSNFLLFGMLRRLGEHIYTTT